MSDRNLPMSRLAPASPNGRDALSVYLLLSSIALALVLAWVVFGALRPLRGADAQPAPPVVDVPGIEDSPMRFDGRRAVVERLGSQNYFAFGRGEWAERPIVAQADEPEPVAAPIDAVETSSTDTRVVNDRGEVLIVAEKDDASAEFRRALENIALKGIFQNSGGAPFAMIWRKHEEKAGRSTSFTIGDEFVEKNAGGDPWRIEHIDLELARVAVSRSGETVWLNLRTRTFSLAGTTARISDEVFDPRTSVPVVEQITMDELRVRLIREGLTPSEVDAMIAEAEAFDPERQAMVKGLVDAVSQVQPANPTNEDATDQATPSDMQTLLEMMANNVPPTPEMLEKFNNPQPAPEPDEDEDPE